MNKTQEREIAAFVESLELHLARLIEEAAPLLADLNKEARENTISGAILGLWKLREQFDPLKTSLAEFFGAVLRAVLRERIFFKGVEIVWDKTEEDRAVLAAIGRPEIETELRVTVHPDGHKTAVLVKIATKMEPPRKVGKECPPCFRCRYFYGWLPIGEFVPEKHSDPEIAEACERLDRRKIAIAHWVRSGKTWTEAELQQE